MDMDDVNEMFREMFKLAQIIFKKGKMPKGILVLLYISVILVSLSKFIWKYAVSYFPFLKTLFHNPRVFITIHVFLFWKWNLVIVLMLTWSINLIYHLCITVPM